MLLTVPCAVAVEIITVVFAYVASVSWGIAMETTLFCLIEPNCAAEPVEVLYSMFSASISSLMLFKTLPFLTYLSVIVFDVDSLVPTKKVSYVET